MTVPTSPEVPAPKHSDTNPMIKKLRAFGEHPKTPKFVGRIVLGLANHRTQVSDWSEHTLGTTSPQRARLDAANHTAQARLAESDRVVADQRERIRQEFGSIGSPESLSVTPAAPGMPEQAHSLSPQEVRPDDRK
jgi:hypothetical protein